MPAITADGRWSRAFVKTVLGLAFLYLLNASVQGATHLLPRIGWTAVLLGGTLVGLVALGSRNPLPTWAIVILGIAVAAVWGLLSQGEPASDFAIFYRESKAFADGPSFRVLYESKSPTTVMLYGFWMAIVGTSIVSAKLFGAIALGVSIYATSTIVSLLGYPRRVSQFAALLFALSPGLIAYSAAVSSEAALLTTLLPGLVLFVKASRSDGNGILLLSASGVLLGLAYLAVPVGGFFAIGVGLFILVGAIESRDRRSLYRLVAVSIGLLLMPAFQASLNAAFTGDWSPMSSSNAAMGILNGTSISCLGRWCPDDLALAGFIGDDAVDFDEASERALAIAGERWRSDPWGLFAFSATTKVQQMWRDESHMLGWAIRGSSNLPEWEEDGTLALLNRIVDSYYLAILLALPVALAVVWRRRDLPAETSAFAFGMVGTGAIHMVMVVQQRYHVVFMPFLFGLIAIAVFGSKSRKPLTRNSTPAEPDS